jgi:hypothetical protein
MAAFWSGERSLALRIIKALPHCGATNSLKNLPALVTPGCAIQARSYPFTRVHEIGAPPGAGSPEWGP